VVVAADYPFLDVLWTILIFFLWVMWFWILIVVLGDLFSRAIFVLFLPFLGVLVYLGVNGDGMAERRAKDVRQAQTQTDEYIRQVASSGGAAGEIERAKALLDSGAIDQAEFNALKQKALAAG
jgi:ABC-type transport system involved in cytochrome bd biosynthesis fused ATPase/permease subunit